MSISVSGSQITFNDASVQNTAATGFGFKNRIINGAMGIWQRGTSFSSFSSGSNTYTADRFASFVNGTGGTIAVTQQAVTPTTFTALGAAQDPQYYLQYQCSVLGSVTYMDLNQRIEDVRTFAGQNMTVSFYAKADTSRTIGVSLYQNFGSGGSADVSGSATNVTIGTSWARYTVTIACNSISGKTIGAGSWVGVVFSLPVSTFTLSFALIQAELGSTATSFDYRPYGTELVLCQRYCYTPIASDNYDAIANGYSASTTSSWCMMPFPVNMRSAPTMSSLTASNFGVQTGTGTAVTVTGISMTRSNPSNAWITANVASGLTNGFGVLLIANNQVSQRPIFSAEL